MAAASAAAQSPCADADALLAARQLAPAKEAYLIVLDESSGLACAIDGLERSTRDMGAASAHYELGLAFQQLSDNDKARQAFAEALALDASLEAAAEALKSLSAPPVDESDDAGEDTPASERLARAGLVEAARSKLAEEVGQGPEPGGDLLRSLGDQRRPFWRNLLLDWGPWVRTILEIGLIVGLLCLVVVRFVIPQVVLPSLSIEPFKGSVDDKEIGAELVQFTEHELERLARRTSRDRLGFVSGEVAAQTLPSDIGSALPLTAGWMQAFPALVNWLRPQRPVRVSGSLHVRSGRGAGATLRMLGGRRLIASQSFWLDELEPDEPSAETIADYYRLGVWMASWLMFQLPRRWGRRRVTVLGTDDWQSYAWFQKGCAAEADREPAVAEDCFRRSLVLDPLMRGAKVNLAKMLSRAKRLVEAEELLEEAKREAAHRGWLRWWDPTFYSAAYSHAVVALRRGRLEEAIDEAATLRSRIGKAKRLTLWHFPLHDYLSSMQPEAEGLFAGLVFWKGAQVDEKTREWARGFLAGHYRENRRAVRLSPRSRYNVACALSLFAAHLKAQGEDPKPVEAPAVKLLISALRASWRLQDNFWKKDGTFDTSLAHVYQGPYKDVIDEVRKELEAPPAPPSAPEEELPLARIPVLGEHAARLKEVGAATPEQLLIRLLTPDDRSEIVRQLGIADETAVLWGLLLELIRLDGMSLDYLILLSHAGYRTRGDLRAVSSADALAERLADVATACGIAAPEDRQLARWLDQARRPTVLRGVGDHGLVSRLLRLGLGLV